MIRHPIARLIAIALLSASCAGPPPAPAPAPPPRPSPRVPLPEALVLEVEATGGFSPWQRIRYAIEQVNGRPMLVHERHYYGHEHGFDDGQPARRTLLDATTWRALHDGLERCRLGALEPSAPPQEAHDPPRWRWRVRQGQAGDAPDALRESWLDEASAASWSCLAVLEEVVAEQTEPIVYERVFVAASERGRLDITTVPVARVYIDGVDIGRSTPLWQLALPAGEHAVRLVTDEEGLERSYEVVIEAGQTTILDFDLRR